MERSREFVNFIRGTMKRAHFVLGVTLIGFSTIVGCNRPDNEPGAGKGGSATLRITPVHHSTTIDSAVVYIKYNASDIPTTYDDSVKCVMIGGKPVALFSGLRKGNYYIFGRGYDLGVPMDPAGWFNVKGGMSYEIKEEVSLDIIVPVSEVH